jgi:hypothetical protein
MPQSTYQDRRKKEKAMLQFQNKNASADQEAYAETLLLKKVTHQPLSQVNMDNPEMLDGQAVFKYHDPIHQCQRVALGRYSNLKNQIRIHHL